MAKLSPAALAVWEAFNQDEPGVFVDYGDCLAAALYAAADQVVPEEPEGGMAPRWIRQEVRRKFLAIAAELEQTTP